MEDLIFLSHRIPYPPDKGEKIRAWHILRHLARSRRVHVGCFMDDPADAAHVATLRAHCADLACFPLDRRRQKLRALARVQAGQPLSPGYFDDERLHRWVAAKRAAGIAHAYVYCSAMAPYLAGAGDMRRILDMVDMDSAKWRAYAARSAWPMRALWRREADTLLAFERRAAADYDATLFVSQAEAAEFLAAAPEAAARVGWLENGVDFSHFAPAPAASPFSGTPTIVFTGTMDYWPNIDAVTWFAETVLPLLRVRRPDAVFCIVGAHPVPSVQRRAELRGVVVTGRVPDVRPYLSHADLVVAPLRIARGVQNKVLEAMAMARPVLATPQAFAGLRAAPGRDLLVADGARPFAEAAAAVLAGEHPGLGAAARAAVVDSYGWEATLRELDALYPPPARTAMPERQEADA
jgi:sugar transferase (PEP-CTERM/EpsH1 system associated)